MKTKGVLSFLFTVIFTASAFADDQTRISHGADGQEHVFTRDTSNPALGDAWRDESGMVWGDIIRNTDHYRSVLELNQSDAATHCENIGAQLPSREDFARLRGYMGTTTFSSNHLGSGYTPQVLPNHYRSANYSYFFWTKAQHPYYTRNNYAFDGLTGNLPIFSRTFRRAVRCVISPNALPPVTAPVVSPIVPRGNTRTSHGADGLDHVFTRDTSVSALGDAWRDESGLIWGDAVRNSINRDQFRSIREMVHSSEFLRASRIPIPADQWNGEMGAVEYCASLNVGGVTGVRLPAREDFERLSRYMGATGTSTSGYVPQAIPNLYSRVYVGDNDCPGSSRGAAACNPTYAETAVSFWSGEASFTVGRESFTFIYDGLVGAMGHIMSLGDNRPATDHDRYCAGRGYWYSRPEGCPNTVPAYYILVGRSAVRCVAPPQQH